MQSSDDENKKRLTKIPQVRRDKEIGRLEQLTRNNDDIPVKMTTEDDIGNMKSLTKALDSTIIPLRWIILSCHEKWIECLSALWEYTVELGGTQPTDLAWWDSLHLSWERSGGPQLWPDQTAHPHLSLISESLMMTEARRNKGSSPVTFEKIMSVKYFCSLNHGGAMIALHKMESLRPSISKITRDAIRTPGQSQFRTRNRNFQQIKYQVFRGFRRGSSDLRFQIYL